MKRDDERREYRRLEGQLDALEEDIQAARHALERATSAHYEDFFSGARVRAHPEEIGAGERVTLRDGSTVMVRPVRPADTALVRDGFEHLSAVTRYRKFLFADCERFRIIDRGRLATGRRRALLADVVLPSIVGRLLRRGWRLIRQGTPPL